VVIGVTLSFFILVSAMGVLISLVAIPLRENVPNFCVNTVLRIPGIWLEIPLDTARPKVPLKRLQVIEIPNT
jgi:hypothetical protein